MDLRFGLSERLDISASWNAGFGLNAKYQFRGAPKFIDGSQWVASTHLNLEFDSTETDQDSFENSETIFLGSQELSKANTNRFASRLAVSTGYQKNRWLYYGSLSYQYARLDTKYTFEGESEQNIVDPIHTPAASLGVKFQAGGGFNVGLNVGASYLDFGRTDDGVFDPVYGINLGWKFGQH